MKTLRGRFPSPALHDRILQFCSQGDSRLVNATFDRTRPDDSILLLISIPGRFDNEIVRNALKDLADQFWPGDAV